MTPNCPKGMYILLDQTVSRAASCPPRGHHKEVVWYLCPPLVRREAAAAAPVHRDHTFFLIQFELICGSKGCRLLEDPRLLGTSQR